MTSCWTLTCAVVGGNDAHRHSSPTNPHGPDGLLHRAGQPDHLEGVVNTAARKLAHRVHHVFVRRVDHIRRAERCRQPQLGRVDVRGDDPRCPGQHGAHDRAQPNSASTDHEQGRAGLHPGRIDDGADAGHHCAAHDGRDGHRYFLRDLQYRLLGADRVLGEARHASECRISRSSRLSLLVPSARSPLPRMTVPTGQRAGLPTRPRPASRAASRSRGAARCPGPRSRGAIASPTPRPASPDSRRAAAG